MAGGMQRDRSRPSLAERAADSAGSAPMATGPAGPDADRAGARPARGGTEAGRHCWVVDPPEWPGTWPGLLVEWRQRAGGWHGRVAYTVGGPHGPVLIEAWLPADRLRQR